MALGPRSQYWHASVLKLCVNGDGRPRRRGFTRCAVCEADYQRRRNARPERRIYKGDWPAESLTLRHAQPWCSTCGSTDDLTVDHPTRAVLCRSCHMTLENARRREKG